MANTNTVQKGDMPSTSSNSDTAVVFVGSEKKKFVIHTKLLCTASPFFDRALNGNFTEAASQEVTLEEEAPELFEYFFDWLYNNAFSSRTNDESESRSDYFVDHLELEIYLMADRLMAQELQMSTLNELCAIFHHDAPTIPSPDFVSALFETPGPRALQLHVVDHVTYWLNHTPKKDQWVGLIQTNDRFGSEVAQAMIRSNTVGMYNFSHPSKIPDFFHKHGITMKRPAPGAKKGDEGDNQGQKRSGKPLEYAKLSRSFNPDPW